MTHCDPNIWAARYSEALKPGVIKLRAETRGEPVRGLAEVEIEVACDQLKLGLQHVNLITAQTEAIILLCIERALAHARAVYSDPTAALRAAYQGVAVREDNGPTLLTGLAGVGKSRVRLSIQRVLFGRTQIRVDDAHPETPLIDYTDCKIGQQSSVLEVLRPLANPEIASGTVKANTSNISAKCAAWQRSIGACLLGVDETQFMAQSETANTLITRTLLAIGEIGLPWFYMANYSLVWKLLARPSEAIQRLIGHPIVLLPDPPKSRDWEELMKEFDVVLGAAFEFKLSDRSVDLWNMSAGLKRELVKLLVQAYRMARHGGATMTSWAHVEHAFQSVSFSASRRDVNLLIAHASQGGKLRKDLRCPFEGPEIASCGAAYQEQLRGARAVVVARESVKSAMTGAEKAAIDSIEKAAKPVQEKPGTVVSLPRAKPRTLDQMLQAGKDLRESLGREPSA